MAFFSTFVLATTLLSLAACSESDNSSVSNDHSEPKAETRSAAIHNSATDVSAPAHKMTTQQQAAVDAAKDMPKQGVVKEMMHAAGYTYMHVDTGSDQPVWVAATMMRVKPEDSVQWGNAAVMSNFNSKSLHRTFDKILFVSNASVIH
jgi:hypothetical protein